MDMNVLMLLNVPNVNVYSPITVFVTRRYYLWCHINKLKHKFLIVSISVFPKIQNAFSTSSSLKNLVNQIYYFIYYFEFEGLKIQVFRKISSKKSVENSFKHIYKIFSNFLKFKFALFIKQFKICINIKGMPTFYLCFYRQVVSLAKFFWSGKTRSELN